MKILPYRSQLIQFLSQALKLNRLPPARSDFIYLIHFLISSSVWRVFSISTVKVKILILIIYCFEFLKSGGASPLFITYLQLSSKRHLKHKCHHLKRGESWSGDDRFFYLQHVQQSYGSLIRPLCLIRTRTVTSVNEKSCRLFETAGLTSPLKGESTSCFCFSTPYWTRKL